MNRFRRLKTALGTSMELIRGLWRSRYWWLLPVIFTLLPLGFLFTLLQSVPLVAPFVYALF